MADHETRISDLEDRMTSVEADVAEQGTVTSALEPVSLYLSADPATNSVKFTGANVFVQSGSGATDDKGTLTGLGNLIVGYDEVLSGLELPRTGSHNLVVGQYHGYSGWGGVVFGSFNDIREGDTIETFDMREKPRG